MHFTRDGAVGCVIVTDITIRKNIHSHAQLTLPGTGRSAEIEVSGERVVSID